MWEPRPATDTTRSRAGRHGINTHTNILAPRVRLMRFAAQTTVAAVALTLTAWSAIVVKEMTVATPLVETNARAGAFEPAGQSPEAPPMLTAEQMRPPPAGATRWFDGRRAHPVRTVWMRVTAYSPDARSCGRFADGKTATMHSVWTNAMRLVAADPNILPYGSIISVPGYADGEIVPVLDCGGAIKGMRLDVLMPTHAIARRWGVRDIPVTIWAYED